MNQRMSMFDSPGALLIAALMILHVIVSGLAQGNSRLVGPLEDSSVADGCGCYFQSPAEVKAGGQKYVFFSDLSETGWVNIDGRDVGLKRVKGRGSPARSRPHRRGEKTIEFYEGGGVKVRLEMVVTRPCPAGEETCEYVGMRATITAQKGGRRQVVRGAGGCGC